MKEYVRQLSQILRERHETVWAISDRLREDARYRFNRKIGLQPQFQEGDWVMLSKSNTDAIRDKLRPTWTGPYLVSEVNSDNTYRLIDLRGKVSPLTHSSRLLFYEGINFAPSNEMVYVWERDTSEAVINTIHAHRVSNSSYELLVEFKGFDENISLWIEVDELVKSHNAKLREYVIRSKDADLAEFVESLGQTGNLDEA